MIQRKTIETLKEVLTTASALISLQYDKGADKIIFVSDVSLNE